MGRILRRQFLIATGALLATGLVRAQPSLRRIAWLFAEAPSHSRARLFKEWATETLPRLGYVEGRNLRVEWRYAEDNFDRLPGLAEELVRLKVDLIVTVGNQAAHAAVRATQTIPILINVGRAVESGFVKSLARPGGNVTGLDWAPTTNLQEKTYQLLKDARPAARRVVTLWNPKEDSAKLFNAEFDRQVTAKTGMAKFRVAISRPEDLEPALRQIDSIRPDVLYVGTHEAVRPHFSRIAAFAQERKLPSISDGAGYLPMGGLLSFAANTRATIDRLGSYIDKILKGAKPGDLPVEQPTKYELVLNMKTAKAMGIALSPSFLLRVDRVIE